SANAQVGDVDGDGILDFMVMDDFSQQLVAIYGNGDGTFGHSQFYGPLNGYIAAGDFNGDRRSDMALANGTSVTVIFATNGLNTPSEIRANFGPSPTIAAADFNGDGISD